MAFDLEQLLAPIPGDAPTGISLKYDKIYDDLKATRRRIEQKRDKDRGEKEESIQPELDLILSRTAKAIASQSKDLQLAVWYVEAATQSDGFEALPDGLRLVRSLLERYWENLHPPIEPDDPDPLDLRASVLTLLNSRLPVVVKLLPLTDGDKGTYSLFHYELPRTAEPKVMKENGWPDAQAFDAAMLAASVPFLVAMFNVLSVCLDEAAQLQAVIDSHFVKKQPTPENPDRVVAFLSLKRLADALDEARGQIERALRGKGVDPQSAADKNASAPAAAPAAPSEAPRSTVAAEPAAAAPPAPAPAIPKPSALTSSTAKPSSSAPPSSGSGPVTSRDAALARVAESVHFMVHDNDLEPTPYILSRAVAFGVLYAFDNLDKTTLPAPPVEVRDRLRALNNDADWRTLIHEAESALAAAPKQAWLDVHRWVATALQNLGQTQALAAVEGQMRALLAKHPGIIDAELDDGTPAASRDTKQWLQQFLGRGGSGGGTTAPAGSSDGAGTTDAAPGTGGGASEAQAMMRSGRPAEGLALLQARVVAASTGRDRFFRQLELADACLTAGQALLALPILDALVTQIDRDRLDTWEDSRTIAHVYSLFIRCSREHETPDSKARAFEVFGRLCRVDPAAALALEQGPSSISRWFRR